jgi:anti-sigma regulatory factor (Ser/Thr protein kinase)
VAQSTDSGNNDLVLNGNLRELERLTAETASFCRDRALGDDVEFDLNLVLEELFTNSVRHGGCDGMEGAAEFGAAHRSTRWRRRSPISPGRWSKGPSAGWAFT